MRSLHAFAALTPAGGSRDLDDGGLVGIVTPADFTRDELRVISGRIGSLMTRQVRVARAGTQALLQPRRFHQPGGDGADTHLRAERARGLEGAGDVEVVDAVEIGDLQTVQARQRHEGGGARRRTRDVTDPAPAHARPAASSAKPTLCPGAGLPGRPQTGPPAQRRTCWRTTSASRPSRWRTPRSQAASLPVASSSVRSSFRPSSACSAMACDSIFAKLSMMSSRSRRCSPVDGST